MATFIFLPVTPHAASTGQLIFVPGVQSDGLVLGLAIDSFDNIYVAQNYPGYVWKITPGGTVQKIAGSGTGTFDGNSAPALSASLAGVHSLAFDSSGSLLMASWDWLWRLNPDGIVAPLARVGQTGGYNDYIYFQTIAASRSGVFIVNDGYQILRLDPSGSLSVYAGIRDPGGYGVVPFSDGCALSGGLRVAIGASLYPGDITVDASGRLYIADQSGRVRRIDSAGSIRTIAGTGPQPHESPSGTAALQALLYNPLAGAALGSIAADGLGNMYFAEPLANRVQKITANGIFVTVAGTDSPPPGDDPACYSPSGDVLSNPSGVAVDTNGNVYISDTGNHRILRVTSPGTAASQITTIAGTDVAGITGNGGPATAAGLSTPTLIEVDPQGQIYFLDTLTASNEPSSFVRRIRTDGIIEAVQVPPQTSTLLLDTDGSLIVTAPPGLYRQISGQFYLVGDNPGNYATVDPSGVLYGFRDRLSRNCHRDFVQGFPSGVMSTDPHGNFFSSTGWAIWQISPIPPPAVDTPSPYVDSPGIYNAASNLVAYETIPPPPGCGFSCFSTTEEVNDSITGNEILRITGGCLGPLQVASDNSSSGPTPITLSSTQVLFDGTPAPLLSVQSAEILAVAPQEVASESQVQIAIANSGIQAAVSVLAAPAVPGVFATGNLAAAVNQDGSINGPDHPAPVGSTVALFLTGAGANNPALQDGVPAGAPVPLALPVTVLVGQIQAEVTYAGAAPDMLGVAQLNVVIPAGVPAEAALQISVGGISRSQIVSLVIQP